MGEGGREPAQGGAGEEGQEVLVQWAEGGRGGRRGEWGGSRYREGLGIKRMTHTHTHSAV